MPVYYVMQDNYVCTTGACTTVVVKRERVYGGSMTPIVLKWNFTHGKRVVPLFAVEGGAIFSTRNVPAGNTSWVNYTPGGAGGVQWFRDKSAMVLSLHVTHISNANMGTTNPGMNASVWLRMGYSWWR